MTSWIVGRSTAVLWLAAIVLLAACAGQTAPGDAHPPLEPSPEAFAQVEQCMAEAGFSKQELQEYEALQRRQAAEGLEIPADAPRPPVQAAWERCSAEAGTLVIVGEDPEEVAGDNERWRQWTGCMVERGWEVELVQDPSLPNRLSPEYEQPKEGEALAAFNEDLKACAKDAGIPYGEE